MTGHRSLFRTTPGRTRATRRAGLLVLLLALVAGLLTSCAGKTYALVMGGPPGEPDVVIDDANLQEELTTIAGDPVLLNGLVQGIDPYTDASKTAFSTEYVSSVLTTHVQLQSVITEAARRNVSPTSDEVAATEKELVGQIGQASSQGAAAGAATDGQATLDKLGPFKDVLLKGVTAQSKLAESVTPSDEDVRKAYEATKEQLGESACASHILILASTQQPDAQTGQPPAATDAEYAAALAKIEDIQKQLDGGAKFEDLAKANSQDPGSATKGGALGCVSQKGQYVKAFDDAVWSQPVGEVGPPVKTEYGYHLIEVTHRGVPEFDEVKSEVSQTLARTEASKITEAAFNAMDVTVNPRYGSWQKATGKVVPIEGAAQPTVPTTPTTLFDASSLGVSPSSTPRTAPTSTPEGSTSGTAPERGTPTGEEGTAPSETSGTAGSTGSTGSTGSAGTTPAETGR